MELTPKQLEFMQNFVRVPDGAWYIDPDTGLINTTNSVYIDPKGIEDGVLPVSFGRVDGDVSMIAYSEVWGEDRREVLNLKSLKGFPIRVTDNIYAWDIIFERLDWEPEFVGCFCFHLNEIQLEKRGVLINEFDKLFNNSRGFNFFLKEHYYEKPKEEFIEWMNAQTLAQMLTELNNE